MDITKYQVPVDKLRWYCDPNLFDFECTRDLAPLREFLGQDRAIRAIEFGLAMPRDGYNIYVAGLTGTGKTSMVKAYISKLVEKKRAVQHIQPPNDWCYLHNFADADRPQITNLPQGRGKVFREQMDNLLDRLKEELARAFSSEEYKTERQNLVEDSQKEERRLFDELREEARRQGFMMEVTPTGPVIAPIKEGRPMTQAEYMSLDERTRKEMETKRDNLLKKLQAALEKAHEVENHIIEKMQNRDKAVANYVVSRLFENLATEYRDFPQIVQFLNDLKTYTLDNPDIFKAPEGPTPPAVFGVPASYLAGGRDPFLPFKVNVFVDNSNTRDIPVIIETNPNYSNMFGKTERRFLFGGYLSDHTMLKPGAVQLANGGYLLLSAADVLINPAVWPTLKRALKTREVRMEDPYEQFGLIAPMGLKPQPMPIDVKVVLIGDAMLYTMLSMYDEDFWEIFKVKADFNFEVNRTKDNLMQYAAFIAGCCEDCQMHHFDRTGVAKVVEYASRVVDDQEKLSTRFAWIKELVEEAEHWARQDNTERVSAQHVEKAIAERRFRHNLPDERIREMIEKGTIMIDTAGSVVGQINGLSIYSLGDIMFGKPSRITCQTFLGRSGVINIERESQLSGPIHNKGVLILSGYLGWKFAQNTPLSLSASLCFEQSYEGVEGDSASSTEMYALLSSLANVPIKQNIAVTGSVNQKGEIQPIGGVNQKIEGFFEVCRAKGLTGDQGVMIPGTNLRNLMLREEVIDAVKAGKFHIYAVSTIDEGIEIITGVEAGQRRADGTYPEGTINNLVERKLKENADKMRHFAVPGVLQTDGSKEKAVVPGSQRTRTRRQSRKSQS